VTTGGTVVVTTGGTVVVTTGGTVVVTTGGAVVVTPGISSSSASTSSSSMIRDASLSESSLAMVIISYSTVDDEDERGGGDGDLDRNRDADDARRERALVVLGPSGDLFALTNGVTEVWPCTLINPPAPDKPNCTGPVPQGVLPGEGRTVPLVVVDIEVVDVLVFLLKLWCVVCEPCDEEYVLLMLDCFDVVGDDGVDVCCVLGPRAGRCFFDVL